MTGLRGRASLAGLLGTVAVSVLFSIPSGLAAGLSPSAAAVAAYRPSTALPPSSNITYNATTDGFPLSYQEQLPVNYVSTRAYPLLVYLHGKGPDTAWIPGGSGNGIIGRINASNPGGATLQQLVTNASKFGFILIAPSPRSAQGYYVNSPCGGPQLQDTLDAINHEKSLHRVSSIYLLGFSMGSTGAIAIAGHYPGLVKGIALAGAITDSFEDFAYHPANVTGIPYMTCGAWPSAKNATADALVDYMSVMRFHPENFSGIRIYIAAGGNDITAVNSASTWPSYYQMNNTFFNSTCNVATSYGEPANCTVPYEQLRRTYPGLYTFRTVWEQSGVHSIALLDIRDVFMFFVGHVSGGCYTSSYPPSKLIACR